ncbi:MAG: hypothetical protein K1W16_17375, partial [Lachnospiraceae bacterium]
MRHLHFWVPPIICCLLLCSCGANRTNNFASSSEEEKVMEDKSKMEIVEEIMRASEDETRKIFAEMF